MAILRFPDEGRSVSDPAGIKAELSALGITYERWAPEAPVADDTPAGEVLKAYARDIERLKTEGGYVTADVIDITPETPNLDTMLAKFRREHWHDEDEVRLILRGRGLFHLHVEGRVVAVEVEPGDLLRVPRGTWHWFDLCQSRDIRAIRLFQDPSGWTPRYTESRAEERYQPVCLGLAYLTGTPG